MQEREVIDMYGISTNPGAISVAKVKGHETNKQKNLLNSHNSIFGKRQCFQLSSMSVNANITKSSSFSTANHKFQECMKPCHVNA